MGTDSELAIPTLAPGLEHYHRKRGTWAFETLPMTAVLVVFDLASVACAIGISVLLRYWIGAQYELSLYLGLAPFILLFPISFGFSGLYPAIAVHPVTELASVFRGVTATYLILGSATFFHRDAEVYSRAVFLLAWPLSWFFVVVGRAAARRWFSRKVWWGVKAIVLGSGDRAVALTTHLIRNPSIGLRVVGVLVPPGTVEPELDPAIRTLGEFSMAPTLAKSRQIRYAIVAVPLERTADLTQIIGKYGSSFHHVFVIPDLSGLSSLGVIAHDLGGRLGMEISNRLLFRTPRLIKRCFDVTASVAGLMALLPFFLAITLMIRLTSKGPAFFCQDRLGLGGAVFKAWKFRTMVVGSDEVLRTCLARSAELREEWAQDQKLKRDPRVTWVGRVLRKTSMDELPQLWNVVRGDMSLVGPRPIVKGEIERYGDKYGLYQQVRPGLSGMWQVSGRNNTTYEERVQWDEYYVHNWSFWLDLYILGRTVRVVWTGDGAY